MYDYGMTTRKQWTLVATIMMTALFLTALVIRTRANTVILGPGSHAPDFQASTLTDGRTITLDAYEGKVVLLNIWATWCPPCVKEMPSMERLSRRLAGTDFRVVAVSIDAGDRDLVSKFVREYGITFDVLHDPDATVKRTYQAMAVPESFLIDRNGKIVKRQIGEAEWDNQQIESVIRALLAEEGRSTLDGHD